MKLLLTKILFLLLFIVSKLSAQFITFCFNLYKSLILWLMYKKIDSKYDRDNDNIMPTYIYSLYAVNNMWQSLIN